MYRRDDKNIATVIVQNSFMCHSWGKKEWSLAVSACPDMISLVPADVKVTPCTAELLIYAVELNDPTQYSRRDTGGPAKFTDHVVCALQCGSLKVLKKIIGDDRESSFLKAWPNTAEADNILHVALNDRPQYGDIHRSRYYRPALHRESVQYILSQIPKPYTVSLLAEIAYLQDNVLLCCVGMAAWVGVFRKILEKGRAPADTGVSIDPVLSGSIPDQVDTKESCEKLITSIMVAARQRNMIVRNKFYDDALFFLLDNVLGPCAYLLLMEYACSTEAMLRVRSAEVSSKLYENAATAPEHIRVPYLVMLFDLGCPVDPQFLKEKKYSECVTQLWLHMGRAMGVPNVDRLQDTPTISDKVLRYLAGVDSMTGEYFDELASCGDGSDELLSDSGFDTDELRGQFMDATTIPDAR